MIDSNSPLSSGTLTPSRTSSSGDNRSSLGVSRRLRKPLNEGKVS